MRKHVGRLTALGAALAAPLLSTALAFPGTASADPNPAPNPTLNGDCQSTLQNGQSGKPLTLDAGAPLNAPNRLTVGLDSQSQQADGNGPLFALPVGDVVRGLGVGETPAVGSLAANTLCPTAQNAANGVGNTVQQVVGGVQKVVPLPPGPGPRPGPPSPGPKPPTPPGPGQPGGGSTLEPVTSGNGLDGLGSLVSGIFTGAAMLPASFVQAPIVTQVVPGKLPQDQVPTVDAKKAGTAEALPAAVAPARLPLLLAVLALAIVAAALVRAWLRRAPA
ncbi:hypothetical protein [Amycolatopsis benzoatilytica]|uniref:hypothetical protein n=1 Tax=Amycolatopsis benzoatilytica TaxID=346045 RepID=UPI00036C0E0F|nr:hypothetical protein [Amycolatopsis benzoatilytica]